MLNNYLYNGQYLEIFKYYKNNPSIRGLEDPHINTISTILFNDFHYDSFVRMRKLAISGKNNLDIINFYFCLISILYKKDYNFLDTKDLKKFSKFKNSDYKKILNYVDNFLAKPEKKYLDKILKLNFDNDFLDFIVCLCFKFSSVSISESFELFSKLNIIKNNLVNNSFNFDIKIFLKLIDKDTFLAQIFLSKFYIFFNFNNLTLSLHALSEKNSLNSHLLSLYIELNYLSNNISHKNNNDLDKIIPFLSDKSQLAFKHHSLINLFLKNDFSELSIFFNNAVGGDTSNTDKYGFFNWSLDDNYDWDLDNNLYKHTNNFLLHQNARFYLNTLFLLSLYRFQNPNNYNDIITDDSYTVIGGANSLSWANLNFDKFSSKVLFNYTNFHNHDSNFSLLNFSLRDDLAISMDKLIICFEVYDFINFSNGTFKDTQELRKIISDKLNIFLQDINSLDIKHLYLLSIPLVPSFHSVYFNKSDINDFIILINSILKELKSSFTFNFIDINSYLIQEDEFPIQENFINNYFVNPDILIKIINNEIIS